MWTRIDSDGKESLEFRLLHVYYSSKRASKKRSAQVRKIPNKKQKSAVSFDGQDASQRRSTSKRNTDSAWTLDADEPEWDEDDESSRSTESSDTSKTETDYDSPRGCEAMLTDMMGHHHTSSFDWDDLDSTCWTEPVSLFAL